MATVKENLIAAKALIDTPDKWVKHHFGFDGCMCALGALGRALGVDPSDDMGPNEAALGGALPAGFQSNTNLSLGTKVANYNDHPDTTHADIMALYDRAIAAQDGA